MHNRSVTQGAVAVIFIASIVVFSAFSPNRTGQQNTYLHKVSSPVGQTMFEYNADKTIHKIVQLRKTENASYCDVQLPVYKNGRLVKTLFSDDEKATTGDLYSSYDYAATGRIEKISIYRNNVVYTYDSLAYNTIGKLDIRYRFSRNPAKGNWENSGYQQFTWDNEENIVQMDNYGKQPGYNKFINTSSVSYTYDNKENPQKGQPELALMLEADAASMSAHNILTENMSSQNSSQVTTSTYSYAYNAGKYPVRGTCVSGMDAAVVKLEWIKLQ
jgi:hypothetical protein